ncbi:MAG: hypothetical protein M3N08_05630, partial [Pseudomonadota bacterium]|nr:hypothetical protein [Pseudomonadota bacterium]
MASRAPVFQDASYAGASREIREPQARQGLHSVPPFMTESERAKDLIIPSGVIGELRSELIEGLKELELRLSRQGRQIRFREFYTDPSPPPADMGPWGSNPRLDAMIAAERETHVGYINVAVLKEDRISRGTILMRKSEGHKPAVLWVKAGEDFSKGEFPRQDPFLHSEAINDRVENVLRLMEKQF